jgi:hypothetical protein
MSKVHADIRKQALQRVSRTTTIIPTKDAPSSVQTMRTVSPHGLLCKFRCQTIQYQGYPPRFKLPNAIPIRLFGLGSSNISFFQCWRQPRRSSSPLDDSCSSSSLSLSFFAGLSALGVICRCSTAGAFCDLVDVLLWEG